MISVSINLTEEFKKEMMKEELQRKINKGKELLKRGFDEMKKIKESIDSFESAKKTYDEETAYVVCTNDGDYDKCLMSEQDIQAEIDEAKKQYEKYDKGLKTLMFNIKKDIKLLESLNN